MFIFRVLNTVPYSNRVAVKDVVAHIHSYFTCNLLIGLAVLVSWKQFGGKPIECMVPTEFTPAWVQYAENFCWSQDTYFVPLDQSIPTEDSVRKSAPRVSYYQWMPFFLLFNAACFKLPCMIWKYFASQSGMRVGEILRVATDEENAVPQTKRANIEALCLHLQGGLRFHKRLHKRKIVPHKVVRFLNIKYSTYYVTFIYFIAKMAFLVNVGMQIKLLNRYVLPEHTSAYDVWTSLAFSSNHTHHESGVFPRVTLCDFHIRETGNLQTHTVQCVLLINIFTEKIFLVLLAWYIILATFTTCNLFSWLFLMFSETSKEHFIISHLEMAEKDFDRKTIQDRDKVDRFIQIYLGKDGIFLLQLISQHADVVFVTELISALFSRHDEIEQQRAALKRMNEYFPKKTSPKKDDPRAVEDNASAGNSRPQSRTGRRKESRRDSYVPGKGMLSKMDSIGSYHQNLDFEDLDFKSGVPFEDSSDEGTDHSKNRRKDSERHEKSPKKDTRRDSKPEIVPLIRRKEDSPDNFNQAKNNIFWNAHGSERADPVPTYDFASYHGAFDKKNAQ